LSEWDIAGRVALIRRPGYWGLIPAPDELIFKIIPDDTQRLLALSTGEVEGMADVNPRDYNTITRDTSLRLEFSLSPSVLYLGFNQAHAPWQVRECRMAVAFALSPFRYFQDWFPNDAHVAASMVPQGMWGYAGAEDDRQQDFETARQRWQECRDSGVTIPATMTLYVPPLARPYLPDPAGLGAAVQADLATAGIVVQIESPDWQTQWLPDVQQGRADLFLLGWTGINGDPDNVLCPLFCGTSAMFNSDAEGNPLPPDAELAGWLKQAQATTDEAERQRLYGLAQLRVWQDVIVFPLVRRDTAWAYRANIHGTHPSLLETTFFDLRYGP
jgi:peptide/nickel transport system substrate-binding protein